VQVRAPLSRSDLWSLFIIAKKNRDDAQEAATKDEAPRIAANLAKAAGSCWQGFSAAQARPRSGKAVMIS